MKKSFKRNFKRVLSLFLSLMMVIGIIPTSLAQELKEDSKFQRRIIAYFAEWGDQESHQNYTVDKIPWDKVTHINYAFAKVNTKNNKIDFCDRKAAIEKEYPNQLKDLNYKGHFNLLNKYKRLYPNVKTLISVGGWADSKGFYTMTDTKQARETFAKSCIDFIRNYGFDGVDIDYEYPSATSQSGNPEDFSLSEPRRSKLYQNYTELMKVLREEVDIASKEDNKEYLLTAAVPASSWILGGMGTNDALKYLDFANLMTYDFHGAWNGYVGHNSALFPDERDNETKGFAMPVLNIDWAYRYFRGALDSHKINIGVPYYTRGWKNVTPSNLPGGLYGSASKTNGGATGEDNLWADVDENGKEIPGGSNPLWHAKNLLLKDDYKRYFDNVCKVPYIWNEHKKVFLTFEDEESIKHKANYVIDKNLGGVIIWEIDGDFKEADNGKFVVGDTLTGILKDTFDKAGLVKPEKKEPITNTADFKIDFTGNYDHPNFTYAITVKNNTGKEIEPGWELEFDMPKSCFFTSAWGAKISNPIENKDFNHYKITGPTWQGIPNGSSATIQGMIKLCFAKGPQNFMLNGKASKYEQNISTNYLSLPEFDKKSNKSQNENKFKENIKKTKSSVSSHKLYKDFKVVGYYPSWTFSNAKDVPYEKLTHINYAFLLPREDGSLKPVDNPKKLKELVELAHKNDIKVCAAIGGWSDGGMELDPVFEKLASDEKSREKLIKDAMQIVHNFNLDGLDMDWEYPDPGDSSNNFVELMKGLNKELKKEDKLLTMAVSCGRTPDGVDLWSAKAITKESIDLVDFINVMAYDGGNGTRHSSYSFAEGCLDYWKNTRDFPKEKIILGVPFYSRPGWKAYNQIIAQDPSASQIDNLGEAYYNGIPTIKKKTNLAKKECGGIMIWEITQDTIDKTSLINAIAEEFGYQMPDDPQEPEEPEDPGDIDSDEPEDQIPDVPDQIPNEDRIKSDSKVTLDYEIIEEDDDTYTVEMTLKNNADKNEWNQSQVPTYGVEFFTTSKINKFSGLQEVKDRKGGYIAEIKDWQKAIAPGVKINSTIILDKKGKNPKPYGFNIKLLRGTNIQPDKETLPKSFEINKENLKIKDLIKDEDEYYEKKVKSRKDYLMLYNPQNDTQIQIGQADGVFVNGYTGVKILVPSKFYAMGLGFNQEIFGLNPNYVCALGSKENFACAFQKEKQADFSIPVNFGKETWYWGMKEHGDGPFQQEIGNFKEMISFYPDFYPTDANHKDYVKVKEDPLDEKAIKATICCGNSITMTRDFINAIPKYRFNSFVKNAKDDQAEISLITFIYNRGINSVSPSVFTTDRKENLKTSSIMRKNGYVGYGDHVPQIIGIVEKMNSETSDIYDEELTKEDIGVFLNQIRDYYDNLSNKEWKLLEKDVENTFDVLAENSGKDTVSFRYDFLTLLRVAKAHLPQPQPPVPMGENFSYQIINKNK